jgi:hypothetical protein
MAQTERAKCYYITIPGMIQGKISAERGKIAQNQPIRGMISADGGAAVGFREISLPLLYRIRRGAARDELPQHATSSHQQRKITTVLPFRPPSGQTRHGAPHFVLSVFLPCEAPRNLV